MRFYLCYCYIIIFYFLQSGCANSHDEFYPKFDGMPFRALSRADIDSWGENATLCDFGRTVGVFYGGKILPFGYSALEGGIYWISIGGFSADGCIYILEIIHAESLGALNEGNGVYVYPKYLAGRRIGDASLLYRPAKCSEHAR